jgi:hypothetical protein
MDSISCGTIGGIVVVLLLLCAAVGLVAALLQTLCAPSADIGHGY